MRRVLLLVVIVLGCSRPKGEARRTTDPVLRLPLLVPRRMPPCRAPGDPGCNTSCLQRADDCLHLSADFHEPPAELYYNSSTSTPGACPDDCRAYDPCQRKLEAWARKTPMKKECDCPHAPHDIDPCASVVGCACYCAGYKHLQSACPEVARSLGY